MKRSHVLKLARRIAVALCILAGIAIAYLRFNRWDFVRWTRHGGYVVSFTGGRVALLVRFFSFDTNRAGVTVYERWNPWLTRNHGWYPNQQEFAALGVRVFWGWGRNPFGVIREYYLSVPWEMAVLPFLVPPLWAALGWLRRRRRIANGLCVRCGYDLRASDGVCPECGSSVLHSSPSEDPQ